MSTADQELFAAAAQACEKLGYTSYPFNPPEETPYPFVKLGYIQIGTRATKTLLLGRATMQVDIWGDQYSRGQVSSMAQEFIREMSKLQKTPSGLKWAIDRDLTSTEIITDDSTTDNLWRALMFLQYDFY